mmetsp:Transcript_11384/g.32225  ORF Transcript_11384/g.32225 Transcript_11384/m.32225 type:complete len:216 (-) Transcript_11384:16-663(-)
MSGTSLPRRTPGPVPPRGLVAPSAVEDLRRPAHTTAEPEPEDTCTASGLTTMAAVQEDTAEEEDMAAGLAAASFLAAMHACTRTTALASWLLLLLLPRPEEEEDTASVSAPFLPVPPLPPLVAAATATATAVGRWRRTGTLPLLLLVATAIWSMATTTPFLALPLGRPERPETPPPTPTQVVVACLLVPVTATWGSQPGLPPPAASTSLFPAQPS